MPGNSPNERLEPFSRMLDDKKIDSAIISDPKSIFYLTGFSTFKTRINTILLIDSQSAEHVLLVGQTEEKAARDAFPGKLEVYTDYDLKNGQMVVSVGAFSHLARNLLRTAKLGSTVGIEDWHLPQVFMSFIERRLVGVSEAILSMRKRKGKDEMTYHQHATKRLDRTFQAVKEYPRTGKTELQLFRHVNSTSFQIEGAPDHWRHSNIAGDFVAGDRTLETGGPATENRMSRGIHSSWTCRLPRINIGRTRPARSW